MKTRRVAQVNNGSGKVTSKVGQMRTLRLLKAASIVSPVILGGALFSCAPRFRTECPEGKIRVGNGDVDEVCKYPDTGGAGGDAGNAGGGGAPAMGNGGGGSGGVCTDQATRCEGGAQQACDGGQWGEAKPCDIACDKAGAVCVVPVQLAAGGDFACARLSDGTVRCWGNGTMIGDGELMTRAKPVPVPSLEAVVDLTIYENAICALLDDGTALCWGDNVSSRLDASGSTQIRTPAPLSGAADVKQVIIGNNHTCVLNGQKTISCKGGNFFGQLGNPTGVGGIESYNTFSVVQNVSFFPKQVAAIENSTNLALTENGYVYCWGEVSFCGGANDGSGGSAENVKPASVPSVSGVRAIASGTVPCAIQVDGRVNCWGPNSVGQLGRGSRSDGALGPGPVSGLDSVVQLDSRGKNFAHVCAVKEDKTLVCWGSNRSGQLGGTCGASLPCQNHPTDNSSYVPTPSRVPLDGVVEVRTGNLTSSGGSFTCARTDDSKVYCWGDNSSGQLGNGTKGGALPNPTPVVWK